GVHDLHRAGSHESGDGCGCRPRQSAAGAALAGRCVCNPRARSGAAAARGFQRRTHHGERLPAAAVAVLRSHHARGAAGGCLRSRDAGVDGPGGLRPGDARAVSGRAGGGARLAAEPVRGEIVGPAALAAGADVVLAVGTRLQDFTTGSATLFRARGRQILALNVQPLDACKHGAVPLVADAREGLRQLSEALGEWRAADAWTQRSHAERSSWRATAESFTAAGDQPLPSDAQVIGAVQRAAQASDILVGAAGGLPGELHKHWQAEQPAGYHLEYGFSCMGYEIA